MKIKNISNQPLTIPFKQKGGKGIIITINPGQIVYCEPHTAENKQVIIYDRKGKIIITDDEKPQNGQYYHPYGVLSHEEVLALKNHSTIVSVESDDEDEEDEVSEEIDTNDLEISDDDSDDMDYDTDSDSTNNDQSGVEKNKGGRPKGSKNKKKGGRPKKKKPAGRPRKKESKQKNQPLD